MKIQLTPPIFTDDQVRAIAEAGTCPTARLAAIVQEIRSFRLGEVGCMWVSKRLVEDLTQVTNDLDKQASAALREALFLEGLIDENLCLDLERLATHCHGDCAS